MPLEMPHWFLALSPKKQEALRCRLLVRIAALYATEEMTVAAMSEKLGYHPGSMTQASTLAPKMAIAMEGICGRDRLPREMLNPTIFDTSTPE